MPLGSWSALVSYFGLGSGRVLSQADQPQRYEKCGRENSNHSLTPGDGAESLSSYPKAGWPKADRPRANCANGRPILALNQVNGWR
jgi:hypothetical protein